MVSDTWAMLSEGDLRSKSLLAIRVYNQDFKGRLRCSSVSPFNAWR